MLTITRFRHYRKPGRCYSCIAEDGHETQFLAVPEMLIIFLREMGVDQVLADRALSLKVGESYSVLTLPPDGPENEPAFELPGEFPG